MIYNTLFKRINYQNKRLLCNRHVSSIYIDKNVIIKSINNNHYNYKNEFTIIKQLNHRNIIKLVDSYCDDNEVRLIYPFYKNKDIHDYLISSNYDDETVDKVKLAIIFKKIIQPIKYLHINNFVHLDLKLENILLDIKHKKDNILDTLIANEVILIDFELTRHLPYEYDKLVDIEIVCGTKNYMPPEIFEYKYGFASDIYSLGCIFFLLQFKRFPIKNDYLIQPELKLIPELRDITMELLSKNHKHRPNIFGVEELLDCYIDNNLS